MASTTKPRREAIGGDAQNLEIFTGTGVPTHSTVATTAIYLRQDPASASTALYITHNNGTTWTAIAAP